MSSPSFVLVDGNPQTRGALRFGLAREGHPAWEAASAAEAEAIIAERGPRVAVVAAAIEGSTGLELAARLAAAPARTPAVLFLGDRGDREAALEAGARLHLAQPVALKDALTLARLLAEPAIEGRHGPLIRARIRDLPLYPLVHALVTARATAVVLCSRGRRFGQVAIAPGAVAAVEAGERSGAAALEQLVLWTDGEIEVRLGTAARRVIVAGAPELLEKAARTLREVQEAAAPLGGLDGVLVQDLPRATAAAGTLPREVTPIVRLCDGSRTLLDVVEDSPLRRGETLRVIGRLLELGLIVADGDAAPVAAARTTTPASEVKVAPSSAPPAPHPRGRAPVSLRKGRKAPRHGKPRVGLPQIDGGPGGMLSSGRRAPLDEVLDAERRAGAIADGPPGPGPAQTPAPDSVPAGGTRRGLGRVEAAASQPAEPPQDAPSRTPRPIVVTAPRLPVVRERAVELAADGALRAPAAQGAQAMGGADTPIPVPPPARPASAKKGVPEEAARAGEIESTGGPGAGEVQPIGVAPAPGRPAVLAPMAYAASKSGRVSHPPAVAAPATPNGARANADPRGPAGDPAGESPSDPTAAEAGLEEAFFARLDGPEPDERPSGPIRPGWTFWRRR